LTGGGEEEGVSVLRGAKESSKDVERDDVEVEDKLGTIKLRSGVGERVLGNKGGTEGEDDGMGLEVKVR